MIADILCVADSLASILVSAGAAVPAVVFSYAAEVILSIARSIKWCKKRQIN